MEDARPKILIVEDDTSTAEAVAFHMRAARMDPTIALDGPTGLRALRNGAPDALVLDLMLPGVDGWHIIREAREWAPRLPIIVVTARTNEHDRVEVLSLGADDVMAKPFSMRELIARVTAALRRTAVENAGSSSLPVSEGELSIDPERMSVIVAGRPAGLTPLEFKLLWTLADARDRALSRDEIFRRVWGGERAHGDRSVDVLVRRLRRKVDEVGGRYTYIQTLHGVGYRFQATLRRMPGGSDRDGFFEPTAAPGL
ncbi:MAG: response regulator transcription factor [Thermoleophilia bacterium]